LATRHLLRLGTTLKIWIAARHPAPTDVHSVDAGDLAERMDEMDNALKDIVEDFNATHEDVRYIRNTVNMLVRNDAAQDAAMKTLTPASPAWRKKLA
jgi:hypothetical protein